MYKLISFIGIDKICHIAICYAICYTISEKTGWWWLGLILAILFGIAKGLMDKYTGKGVCEVKDFIADVVGAMLAALVFSI